MASQWQVYLSLRAFTRLAAHLMQIVGQFNVLLPQELDSILLFSLKLQVQNSVALQRVVSLVFKLVHIPGEFVKLRN